MDPKTNRTDRYIQYGATLLVIALILLIALLVVQYRSLERSALANAREFRLSDFLKRHGPLAVSDIGNIRPWMTFDYVNRLFNLPPEYLKTRLSLSDSRYPRLSLSSCARKNNLDGNAFITSVQNAVRDYLTKGGT